MKFLTTEELLALNKEARTREGWRYLEITSRLDPNGIHIVYSHMLVSDRWVRMDLMVKAIGNKEPVYATLDVHVNKFNMLRNVESYKKAGLWA